MALTEPIIIRKESGILKSIPGILFSLLFSCILIFLQSSVLENDKSFLFLFIFFHLLCAGFIIGSLREIKKTKITLSSSEVRFHNSGVLCKTTDWTEPLRNFTGVMGKSRTVRRNKTTYTFFDVILKHPDKNKTLLLEAYEDERIQRSRLEFFSKALSADYIETRMDGKTDIRKTEDLDKNVSRLLLEGKLKRTFASKNPYPGKKYRVLEAPDGFVLKREYRYLHYLSALFFVGAVLLFVLLPKNDDNRNGWGTMSLIFAAITFFYGFTCEVLMVAGGRIIYYTEAFRKYKLKKTIIPLNTIENISVANDFNIGSTKRFNKAVKISSDQNSIYFAHYSSDAEREWIADKLIDLSVKEKADSEII